MEQTCGDLKMLEKLTVSEIFKSIKADQLEDMVDFVSRITLDAGEILIEEGTESSAFYIVESGDIEVYFSVPGQKNYLEACRLKIGSPVGEMALLEDDVHTARVVAKEASSVLKIDSKAFLMFCELRPEVGFIVMRNLAKLLSGRLRYTDQFVRHFASN